jgi:hypothetical protein
MDSDGGMPGADMESRAIATVVALLAFLSKGHTAQEGAFRSHVARLTAFLVKSLSGLSHHRRPIVARVIDLANRGKVPAGKWIEIARVPGDHWKEVEKAC